MDIIRYYKIFPAIRFVGNNNSPADPGMFGLLSRLSLLICALLVLMAGSSEAVNAFQDLQPLELNRVDSRKSIGDFFVIDLDGDGVDDFLELFADRRGYMARPFTREILIGPALYQRSTAFRISSISPTDIDTLPGTEIAIAFCDGDSVWVQIVAGSAPEKVLCRTEAVHGKNISDRDSHYSPGWDGCINRCYFEDLDGDGVKEIIVPVTVGFDLYPRGIYVYQYPEGRLLWDFPLAGNPLGISFGDADNNGFKEIYLKTWACSNGAVYEDRMDTTAYAFSIDHLGNQIWSVCLGDKFDRQTGNIHVCDCDNDDTLEVYYTVLFRSREFDRHIRILEKHRASDNLFITQRLFDAAHHYREIFSGDMNGDDRQEIIINDHPSILDPDDLSTIHEGSLVFSDIALVEDINGFDGRPGIIVKKKDSLYLFDYNMDVQVSYGTNSGGHILSVKHFQSPFGKSYLGIVENSHSLEGPNSNLYILEIVESSAVSRLEHLLAGVMLFWPVVVIAFVLGIPFGIVLFRFWKLRRRPPVRAEQYYDLLSALTTFNHGQMAGRNLNRLSFLFANLPKGQEKLEEITPNIKSAIDAYYSVTVPQINSITGLAKRSKPLKRIGLTLKNEATRLSKSLKELKQASVLLPEYLISDRPVTKPIDKIKSSIRLLKNHIEPHFKADMGKVALGAIDAITGRLIQEGIGFKFSSTAEDGEIRPPVFFLESELRTVIGELISNACLAMADSEKKTLSIIFDYYSHEAEIKICDTGRGISASDPETLFSREYSTKSEGGGYGLYHARQQVERFGGRIRIYNNADGPGATVQINIKTLER